MNIETRPGLSCHIKYPEIHLELMKAFKKFHGVVVALRFEGKPAFGKNLKNLIAAQKKLKIAFHRHKNLEEKVIFPFLEAHIPRLFSVLQLLIKDHAELELILKSFPGNAGGFQAVSWWKEDLAGHVIGLQHQVDYFWQLLKNHIYLEENIVYEMALKELHQDEIGLLKEKMTALKKSRVIRITKSV